MDSIFSKIIAGDIPAYKIAENDNCVAFLDIFPIKKGHTLVIPKKEVDKLIDLDEANYTELMRFTRKVAKALEDTIPCLRVGMAVVGLEVPHAHIHLIPLHHADDINFSKPKLTFSEEEFQQTSSLIKENFKNY